MGDGSFWGPQKQATEAADLGKWNLFFGVGVGVPMLTSLNAAGLEESWVTSTCPVVEYNSALFLLVKRKYGVLNF